MPNWGKVLEEITAYDATEAKNSQISGIDFVRRKYLANLFNYTNRNIIAYYSGWLQVGSVTGIDINDMDINGFMNAINGLDCTKGLDLIIHTPGGSISATEHLVQYLKSKFGNNIRAIIPQIALSAGTMISFACKEIVMGKQSCLGPFDPQINGVSAARVLEEFKHAIKDAKKDTMSIPFWQTIISKYHPTFLDSCNFACKRSKIIVVQWLLDNMFSSIADAKSKANSIVKLFNKTGRIYDHDKHISITECEQYGLQIVHLEDDQELQDLVLTVHHAFMHTLTRARITKAIENHNGMGMFLFQKS